MKKLFKRLSSAILAGVLAVGFVPGIAAFAGEKRDAEICRSTTLTGLILTLSSHRLRSPATVPTRYP